MSKTSTDYNAAIFFDNDPYNLDSVKDFCSDITCILVPTTGLKSVSIISPEFKKYIKNIGPNMYVNYKIVENQMQYEDYNQDCGIHQEHYEILTKWMNDTEIEGKTSRVAIFDWDETITIMKGVSLSGYDSIQKMQEYLFQDTYLLDQYPNLKSRSLKEDILVYICGGVKRLQFLREMFIDLHKNKVDIAILTSNTGCTKKDFKDLVKSIMSNKIPHKLYCSPFEVLSKGLTLSNTKKFGKLCRTVSYKVVKNKTPLVKKKEYFF